MSGFDREVVITGTGLTSPIGKNVEENWKSVREMRTGIAHRPKNGLPDFLQYTGEVSGFDLPEDIPPKQKGQMKFLNRGALLGFSSTCEAMSGAIGEISDIPPGRRALYVAAGDFTKVGFEFMYPAIKDSSDKNWESVDRERLNIATLDKVNPFFLLESLNNNLFSFLSAFIEFMGPNTSLASLSPCGSNALELAYRSIKQNKADMALAVGYGSWITEIPLYELEGLGILSRCKSGIHSFRPFDRGRDGFIPGEGGAAILLEAADAAEQRGSTVLGKIRGLGNCTEFSSTRKISVPAAVSKYGILSAMKAAGCKAEDLAFIIPHGSGTIKGDRSEMRSIIDTFKGDKTIPVCGLKPYTGHMGAASDIAEIILGVKAVREQTVPATLNFRETEHEFSDLKISASLMECKRNWFLSTSYGVGGQSSSVIIDVTQ